MLTVHDEQDRITSAYLEGREIGPEVLRQVLREQTIRRHIQPVLCGSGREHIGLQPLLDAIAWYLPSPLDRPAVVGQHPQKPEKPEKRKPDPKEPFCGLVFKIVADTKGELYFVRIYSGTLKANSRVYNPRCDRKEMVTKPFHIHADPKNRDELAEAYAGDIVAIHGLKESVTGDTLCETQHPILLESISFAEAVVSKSIEPESSADKQKLIDVLNILKREDPTFDWKVDPETGQTLMTGMGVLHLDVKQHRMERDFRLKVRVGKPRVSYRETIREPVEVEGECIRQTGTGGLFARVLVSFEPHKDEQPILVENRIKPDDLPAFMQTVIQAAREGRAR